MKVSRKPSDFTQPSSKVNNHKGPSRYLIETNSLTVRRGRPVRCRGKPSVRKAGYSSNLLAVRSSWPHHRNLLNCSLGGVLFSPKWISSWNRHCSHYFYALTRKLSGSFVGCSARWKSASSTAPVPTPPSRDSRASVLRRSSWIAPRPKSPAPCSRARARPR